MKYIKFICLLTGGLFLLCNQSHAQYVDTGTTVQSGSVVVGSGTNLGSLVSGDGILSPTGFDNLTFAPGSSAAGLVVDTVIFTTQGNTVTVNGTVIGSPGFNAITFISPGSSVTGETVTNNGTITAANLGIVGSGNDIGGNLFTGTLTGGNVGSGIDFSSQGTINGIVLSNAGTITAGGVITINDGAFAGNLDSSESAGGDAGDAIDFTSQGEVVAVSLLNTGSITGASFSSVTDASIGENDTNSEYAEGGNAADGFAIATEYGIERISIVNQGAITGGYIGTVTNSRVGSNNGFADAGGDAGDAIAISTDDNLATVSISNRGAITGGGVGNNSGVIGGNYSDDSMGGNTGSGISITAYNPSSVISIVNQGAITAGNIATNSGNIGGNYGSSGNAGGNVAVGVSLVSYSSLDTVSLVNYGTITGGAIGNNSSSIGGNHHSNVGGSVSDGVAVDAGTTITGLSIVNYGAITGGSVNIDTTNNIGGQHGTAGGDVGSGIGILSGNGGSNLSVTNYGTITGGNNLNAGDNAGAGILATTGNLTVNNWGAITGGAGANPAGINLMYSGNNTVNLNGHSSVNGPIVAATTFNNNVLNLNFTGLSPATIAALKATIIAQNPLDNWSGTFTVRGVTYTVDPMIINFNLSSYQLQGVTPNQAAIGAALDSATVNPPIGSPLFNLFTAIDNSGNVPAALDQLSPQKFEIYGDLAIAASNFMVQSVDARLNNLRGGSESIDTSGIGGDTVAEIATDNSVAGLTKDDSKESKQIQTAAPAPKQWGFFATGDGLFFRGNYHDSDLQQNARADSVGTIAGVDAKIGDHGVIGAMFAYNNSPVTLDNNTSHASIESYTGGIYGSWHDEGFYLNALGAYTRNNYKSERGIAIPGFGAGADGSANGNQATANLDGGYDWNVTNRLAVGPLAGVQYVNLDINGFNESGAGAADLAVGSENMNSLQSRAGLHANYHLSSSSVSSFALDMHAAWQHEYLDDSRAISASFEGDGLAPFAVQTASPKRDAGVIGLGLNFTFHDRLTLFTEYELEMWSASYYEQTINGGARISF